MALTRAVGSSLRTLLPVVALCGVLASAPLYAQVTPPAATPTTLPAAPSTPAPDSLEGRPIAKVEVLGNLRTDSKIILEQVRSQPGQNYSRMAVDIDTRSIAAIGRFSSVKAEVVPTADNRVIVRFLVTERPIVTAVSISGNLKKTDEAIREVTSIQVGGSIDPFVIESDKRAIEKLYHDTGYNFVTVTVDEDAMKKQGVVHYIIQEGPRVRISDVVFDGNTSLKSSYLSWKIKTKSYIWIFRKGYLTDDDLEADIATIKDLYVGKGFLDVKVSKSIEYTEDKSRAIVHFVIVEGPKYKVAAINVKGNTVFSTEDLMANSPLKTGDYIERDRLETIQRRIEDKYGHEGYIYRTVDIRTSYTGQEGVVDLNINITEGKAYEAGRIIVRGNPNIEDRVIRRQMRIYPQQTYDTVLVRKSLDRLKATRIFSDVKITPIGNEQGVRDALVEVQEGQTGRFLVGAGVSSNSGLIGQISLEQQNFDWSNYPKSWGEFFRGQSFKGAGQYFRILLEPGTDVQRYRVTFEEPYAFDSPYSFGNDFYYFTRVRESWNESRLGDIPTVGRRFGDIWIATISLRAEDVTISNTQDFGNPGGYSVITNPDGTTQVVGNTAAQIIAQQGSHFITSIKPALIRDTTDSKIFPTSGTRALLSVEQYGAMGGELTMTKVIGKFDWYYPIYSDIFDRKTVFIQRNELGGIVAGDSVFYERFYGGGIGSLRGFRFRGVSPRSGVLKDPVGGDFSWLSVFEVNYPIYEDLLRGVVFADVGTVEPDFTFGTIRSDIGAGIRLTLPFFGQLPLALDFAYPTTQSKQDNDRTQIVSFSLGIPF